MHLLGPCTRRIAFQRGPWQVKLCLSASYLGLDWIRPVAGLGLEVDRIA